MFKNAKAQRLLNGVIVMERKDIIVEIAIITSVLITGVRSLFFWIPHIDGLSIRDLAIEHNLSGSQVYRRVKKEMNSLPDNTWLTLKYLQ